MGPEFLSHEPRIIFIIKVISHFFVTQIFEQLSLILKIYFTLENILSISFNPRIIFEFLWALSLFRYASKHSASNHGDVKSDFMEMDGIYLSKRRKRICLKASQASSGSIQSSIASQCMLPNSLVRASQFAFFRF